MFNSKFNEMSNENNRMVEVVSADLEQSGPYGQLYYITYLQDPTGAKMTHVAMKIDVEAWANIHHSNKASFVSDPYDSQGNMWSSAKDILGAYVANRRGIPQNKRIVRLEAELNHFKDRIENFKYAVGLFASFITEKSDPLKIRKDFENLVGVSENLYEDHAQKIYQESYKELNTERRAMVRQVVYEEKQPEQKPAKLINDTNCWLLEVDGSQYEFVGSSFADFLEDLLTRIGYKVEVDRSLWLRKQEGGQV